MVDSPSKLWAIVRREYLERVRTKWFIISTVFGPVIFSLIIFLPILLANRETQRGSHRLIVLDATGTSLGRYVAGALGSSPSDGEQAAPPDVHVVTRSGLAAARTSATRDVTTRLASGYIVLDSSTVRGDSVQYAGRRSDSPSGMTRITQAVRAGLVALRLEGRGISTSALDSIAAMRTPVMSATSIDDTGKSAANPAKAILAFFVAFLLYTSILFYGQSILSGVIEEKLSRVAEIVISSVRPETLLAGKVIGVTAVGITQQVIWVLGSILIIGGRAYIFGARSGAAAQTAPAGSGLGSGMASGDFLSAMIATPWSWVIVVLLFFILGFIFYGSLYAAVGATVGSEQEARQASQPVVMLLVLTILFISPTLANPNSDMARVMSLLPISSPILMPLRMATTDVPPLEVAGSILILLVGCLGAVWIAARIYRVGLLMYGKRPTFRELRRWIVAP